jgi:hypothetical protein
VKVGNSASLIGEEQNGVILSDVPVRLGPKDLSYLRNVGAFARSLDFARDDIATSGMLATGA